MSIAAFLTGNIWKNRKNVKESLDMLHFCEIIMKFQVR